MGGSVNTRTVLKGGKVHSTVAGRRGAGGAAILLSTLMGLSAVSLAASPVSNARFSGKTNESPAEPISFVVSGSGTALTRFKFDTLGCLASPGETAFPVKVGRLALTRSGSFSVAGAKVVNTR